MIYSECETRTNVIILKTQSVRFFHTFVVPLLLLNDASCIVDCISVIYSTKIHSMEGSLYPADIRWISSIILILAL